MDKTFWQKSQEIFDQLLALPEAEQATRLETLRKEDPQQAEAVSNLLASLAEADDFFGGMEQDLSEAIANSQLDPIAAGTRLGPYAVEESVGEGGMAMVYRATRADGEFSQEVALKILKRGIDSADMVQRFRSEKEILARLQHPNIAQILDGGITLQGTPYFVMEYVDGEPLMAYVQKRGLDLRARIELFLPLIEAVRHAHGNLIVHRDLKPSNLLVTPEGRPKLLDFGIAKLLNPQDFAFSQVYTQTEQRLLTPEYAAPEQMQGKAITTATDVYQLGLVLYELLTDRRPFDLKGKSYAERLTQITTHTPRLPSQAVADPRFARRLKGDLDRIILMALRKEPERRYPSVDALLQDLRAYLQNLPVSAQRDTLGYRSRKYYQRNRLLIHAVGLALVAVATVIALYTRALTQERDRAQAEAEKASRTSQFMQNLFYQANDLAIQGEEIAANELLSLGMTQLDTMQAAPDLKAALYQAVGLTFMGMGLNEDAELPLREALRLRPPTAVPTQEDADAYLGLGTIDLSQGHYGAADSLLRLSLAINRELPHPEYSSMVNLLVSLSELAIHQGDYAQSEAYAAEAEQLAAERQDTTSDYFASVLFARGYMALEQEDFEAAIDYFIRLRKLALQRSDGQASPFLAGASHNLSSSYRRAGLLSKAKPLAEEAVAAWDSTVGMASSFYLDIRYNTGNVYRELQMYPEAISFFESSRLMAKEVYGDELSSQAEDVLMELCRTYRAAGEWEAAIAVGKELLARNKAVGEQTLGTANAHGQLAITYTQQGDLAQAEPHWQASLAYFEGGAPTDEYLVLLVNYGGYFLKEGQPEHAQEVLEKAQKLVLGDPTLIPALEQAKLQKMLGYTREELSDRKGAAAAFQAARDLLSPENELHQQFAETIPQ